MEDNSLKNIKNVTDSNKVFKKSLVKKFLNTLLTVFITIFHYFMAFFVVIPLTLLFIVSFSIFKKINLYIKEKCTKQ